MRPPYLYCVLVAAILLAGPAFGQGDIKAELFSKFEPEVLQPGQHPTKVQYVLSYSQIFGTSPTIYSITNELFLSKNTTLGDADDILIGVLIDHDYFDYSPGRTYSAIQEQSASGIPELTIPTGIAGGDYNVFLQISSSLFGDPRDSARLAAPIKILDGIAPAVTINGPPNNSRFAQSTLVLSGTASDDVEVQAIECTIQNSSGTTALPVIGTTTWSVGAVLMLGTNTIRVRARDTNGNYSPEQAVTYQYVTTDALKLFNSRGGTVIPNANGSNLVIGQKYTFTAKANPGFVFNGWSGSVTTNKNPFTFTMDLDTTIMANFRDTKAPELAVISPRPNLRTTNSLLNLQGTAKDNDLLSTIKVQLNGGEWSNLEPRTNWSGSLNLQPGANTIRVYAEDMTGLRSKTNTLLVTYVVMSPFVATVSGSGKLSPNVNGQLLEIGKTYVITAVPNAGHAFVGWSGSTNTTSSRIAFVMRDGFHLNATFRDSVRPTLVITSPKPNTTVNESIISISGIAGDNTSVQKVYFSVDDSAWSEASGISTWTAAVQVNRGPHIFRAYSVDGAGNISKTNALVFNYLLLKGIYTATLYGTEHNAVIVRDDNSAVWIGGSTTFDWYASYRYDFGVTEAATFEYTTEDPALVRGQISAKGIDVIATGTDDSGRTITARGNLPRRSAAGPHAANLGFYSGKYMDGSTEGTMSAILSADGQVTFTLTRFGVQGGGGKGIINAQGTFTASAFGASFYGVLNTTTKQISGTIKKGTSTSTFDITREFTTEAAPFAALAAPNIPSETPTLKILETLPFRFSFDTEIGHAYTIQISHDLENWTDAATVRATENQYEFTDIVHADGLPRFYRIQVLP